MSSYIKLTPSRDIFISDDDLKKIITENEKFINKFNKYLHQSCKEKTNVNEESVNELHNKESVNEESMNEESVNEEIVNEESVNELHNKESVNEESQDSETTSEESESDNETTYKSKHVKSHEVINMKNIDANLYAKQPDNLTINFNIECVVSIKFYKILYKIYRDIIKSYNQLKKFKDVNGKLILTPYQLSALLSVLLNINESDISILCDPKIIKKYSDGKIFKIHSLKILSSNSKNYDKLINMLTNDFDISIEFVNISDRLMTIRYL